jgi:hypothetical protein
MLNPPQMSTYHEKINIEILKNQLQVVCKLGWKLAVEVNGHMELLLYKQSS